MKLLSDILQDCQQFDNFSIQTFLSYIEKLQCINFSDVVTYPIATRGKAILYNEMYSIVFGENTK